VYGWGEGKIGNEHSMLGVVNNDIGPQIRGVGGVALTTQKM
jgi:hypothetical protein